MKHKNTTVSQDSPNTITRHAFSFNPRHRCFWVCAVDQSLCYMLWFRGNQISHSHCPLGPSTVCWIGGRQTHKGEHCKHCVCKCESIVKSSMAVINTVLDIWGGWWVKSCLSTCPLSRDFKLSISQAYRRWSLRNASGGNSRATQGYSEAQVQRYRWECRMLVRQRADQWVKEAVRDECAVRDGVVEEEAR